MTAIIDIGLRELFRHLGRWLANLSRAGDARKRESIDALRAVIVAARQTKIYMRKLNLCANPDHLHEAELTGIWTELGFRLKDLGLNRLAKRCDVTARFWADPTQFDEAYLQQADIGLERIERLAQLMVAQAEQG